MRFHQVEVDDEVFRFVQKQAEPLVDTFNSALRRLLSLSRHIVKETPKEEPKLHIVLPSLPEGIPQSLRHIIEVICLVRGGAYTRAAATQHVAKIHKVFPQTILDKYCRQLSLTASQFDRLLEQTDLGELR